MILPDVNVLVYAHRAERPEHDEMRAWLEDAINGPQPYGLADIVLSGFLRVVTHPRVFDVPTPLATALAFATELRARSNRVDVTPGARHWSIFAELCQRSDARGNRVPDAYLAALAIESGSEWITTDRGFARFPGLRWRQPLD